MNSYEEFELWIEEYKSQIKEARSERPLSDDEIDVLNKNVDYIPEEYKNAFDMAKKGVFDSFEKLPHLLRNYLGALELKKFRDQFGPEPSLERDDVRAYLEDRAMNAALRAGISAEKNAKKTQKAATALDSYMSNILVKRTMLPPTEKAKSSLREELKSEAQVTAAILKNKARQLVFAKVMLLAQLGKYDVIDKNGLCTELDVPVYETLVHGNRTNFVLPSGENSGSVIDAFMGEHGGADAGIEKRTAATHYVKLRSFGKNGILKTENKEQRTYSPFKVFGKQYGMNIAVGGIGSKGPDQKKIITGNGESGHVYMRAEKGDAKHCGSLLVGIEGSAPGTDSYLGNTHGILAKSAKQSAFLADKSIVGKKIGGRQIDLSGISAEDLSDVLNRFSQKYSELQNGANTPDGLKKLSDLNDMLMGRRMDIKKLMEMFNSLGIKDQGLNDVISNARRGYLCKVDAKSISGDEFAQSIRSNFSQEKACAIAEARFAYAGNDLSLCVGAIKELILTHETRTLGWKLLHPIKNYRENATITDLTKRLETNFSRAEIANEFVRESNSFTMDWGESLSNERGAVKFASENKQLFKSSERTTLDVLKEKYSDYIKDASPIKSDNALTMKEELQRAIRERELKRVKIVINAENEANKNKGAVSEAVTHKQSAKDNQKEI